MDGIPKSQLFVKLKDGISTEDENMIVNGLRNTFQSRTVGMLNLSDVLVVISSFDIVRTTFVLLVGTIALIIAFFLLLTSTTQNIQEAVGEYGILRSLGLNKAEGMRIFLYESSIVILSAGILGFGVGMITIILVTSQFYLFVELDWVLEFPYALFSVMVLTAAVTTYLSVYIPMRKVQTRTISSALRATAE